MRNKRLLLVGLLLLLLLCPVVYATPNKPKPIHPLGKVKGDGSSRTIHPRILGHPLNKTVGSVPPPKDTPDPTLITPIPDDNTTDIPYDDGVDIIEVEEDTSALGLTLIAIGFVVAGFWYAVKKRRK